MDLKKLLGINIQKYRRLRNLTQEKLAELTHLDSTTISAIERGKQFVSADNLRSIAKALNIEAIANPQKIKDKIKFNFLLLSKYSKKLYKEIKKKVRP